MKPIVHRWKERWEARLKSQFHPIVYRSEPPGADFIQYELYILLISGTCSQTFRKHVVITRTAESCGIDSLQREIDYHTQKRKEEVYRELRFYILEMGSISCLGCGMHPLKEDWSLVQPVRGSLYDHTTELTITKFPIV